MLTPAGLQQHLLSSLLGRTVMPDSLAGDRGIHVEQACLWPALEDQGSEPSSVISCQAAHLEEGCQLSLAGLPRL